MNDDLPNPSPEDGPSPNELTPTRAERLALVRKFQAQALQRADMWIANLEVIGGDLMGFAHELAPRLTAALAAGRDRLEGSAALLKDADLYLKVVKQVDRVGQIVQKMSPPPGPEASGKPLPGTNWP